MNKSNLTDVVVVGFALFAMFFGAGNLILPPYIGLLAGKSWILTLLGFGLTGIGLPLLGVMVMAKNDGSIEKFSGNFSRVFSILLGLLIILSIGPMLAIPRTGATTYEVAIKPIFPNISPLLSSIIYFAFTYYFAINRSTVIDKIGKRLTPTLLIMLAIIIFKGFLVPIGDVVNTGIKNPFGVSFLEGYHTMDALASIFFAGVVINNIKARGYSKVEDQIRLTVYAGAIAALGLFFVYGGLMYLGATTSSEFTGNIERTTLLLAIAEKTLGKVGKIPLGIAVALACLTTAVGLTVSTGEYFSEITQGKLSYRFVVTATVIFSALIASFGVESIIKFSAPILVTLYPVVIVLMVMNIFKEKIRNKAIYATTIIGALIISIFDGLEAFKINFYPIEKMITHLPFAESGLAWISTAMIGFILGNIIFRDKSLKTKNPL